VSIPSSEPDEDGGLQFERTALAYWRTALAAALAGLLIVRQTSGGLERVVGTVGAVAGVSVIIGIGFARQEALARRSAHLRHRMTGGIVAALVLLQVIAVALVV
jgi:uncharacterized membrane protein YidH (DUF202 family)